jgi:TRAP-type C4-dicarboxylate transport system permease large subunit
MRFSRKSVHNVSTLWTDSIYRELKPKDVIPILRETFSSTADVLFIMGMFMEAAPVIIILLPLLAPPCQALGINMVHFGIVVVVNLQIGGVTPPFGSMMFIVCQMLNLPMDEFVKANIPFLISVLIVLLIITYVPALVLFLPNLLMP